MKLKSTRMTKLISLITVVALGAAILLGGTLALSDFNQHKTNNLENGAKHIDVTLNESFIDDHNWTQGEAVDKKVSVTNVGKSENPEPVFVRLSLKEYMEIAHTKYEYAMDVRISEELPYRFATYPDDCTWGKKGEFIAFVDAADVTYVAGQLGFENPDHVTDRTYANALDATETAPKYYLYTEFGDINGQYGKYLVTKIAADTTQYGPDGIELVAGTAFWNPKPVAADIKVFDSYIDIDTDTDYSIFDSYIWNDTTADVREYVKVIFGNDVIPMSEWLAAPYGAKPIAKWIYDDYSSPTSPYVYWGEALMPGEHTTNFLEAVQLIKQPEDSFFYSIHVDMETTNKDQLPEMEKIQIIPDEIEKAWLTPIITPKYRSGDPYNPTQGSNSLGAWTFELSRDLDIGLASPYKIDVYLEHRVVGAPTWVSEWFDDPDHHINPGRWPGVYMTFSFNAQGNMDVLDKYPQLGDLSYKSDILPANTLLSRTETRAQAADGKPARYPKACAAIESGQTVEVRQVLELMKDGKLIQRVEYPPVVYSGYTADNHAAQANPGNHLAGIINP